jgi:hypothetical protein
LFAVLLSSPQLGLFAYWITYTNVTLSSGMFYLTLIPMIVAIPLIMLLPGKSRITPKKLAIFAIMALIPYALYDWARVPMNLIFGFHSGITGSIGGPVYWEVQAPFSPMKT